MNDDNVRRLSDELRVPVGQSIDVLHAAAILESTGLTDDQARRLYGASDAFALAAVVRARVQPVPTPVGEYPPKSKLEQRLHRTPVGHGLLYGLIALSVAGLLGVVPATALIPTVIAAGATGWVWGAVTSWASFQLAGHGRPTRARRLLMVSACGALVLTAASTAALMYFGLVPWSAAVVAVALVAIQVGSTLLFLSGRRRWLLAAALPGGIAGVLALAARTASRTDDEGISFVIVTLFLTSVLALIGFGLAAVHDSRVVDEPTQASASARLPGMVAVLVYAVLCAAFLLVPQGRLLDAGGDQILGMAGLILIMGLVEWRAIGLASRARALLRTASATGVFRRRLRRLVTRELAVVMACAALTNSAVGAGLYWWGHLNRQGMVLLAVTVPLAAAYLVVLASANTSAYTPLNLCLLMAVAAQLVLLGVFSAPVPLALGVGTAVLLIAAGGVLVTRPVRNFA